MKKYFAPFLHDVVVKKRLARVKPLRHLSLFTSNPDGKVLPGDLTHYVVPDAGVVVDFLEILEFRELQGIVFTQTACQAVQHSKGRRYTPGQQAQHRHTHAYCLNCDASSGRVLSVFSV